MDIFPTSYGVATPIARVGRLARCDSGASAVEFAFVVPVFLLFLIGTMQFGLILFIQHNMSNTARDVSRRVAVGELTAVSATAAAQSTLVNWGVDFVVLVEEPDPDNPADKDITVTITAPMDQAAMFDILGILDGSVLTAAVTMRKEW